MAKLYGKNIAPDCAWCERGILSADKANILCVKKGVRVPGEKCGAFRYDPIKRVPNQNPALPEFSSEEFEI